jgi:hypothetical protein
MPNDGAECSPAALIGSPDSLFGLLMLLVGGLTLKSKRSTAVTNSDQNGRP